jgi:hypothetical protein
MPQPSRFKGTNRHLPELVASDMPHPAYVLKEIVFDDRNLNLAESLEVNLVNGTTDNETPNTLMNFPDTFPEIFYVQLTLT